MASVESEQASHAVGIPPLVPGDRLDAAEFERRYAEMTGFRSI